MVYVPEGGVNIARVVLYGPVWSIARVLVNGEKVAKGKYTIEQDSRILLFDPPLPAGADIVVEYAGVETVTEGKEQW